MHRVGPLPLLQAKMPLSIQKGSCPDSEQFFSCNLCSLFFSAPVKSVVFSSNRERSKLSRDIAQILGPMWEKPVGSDPSGESKGEIRSPGPAASDKFVWYQL